MTTRAAKWRFLSASGQPRRRLSRRRQQLPTPVLSTRKSEGAAIREELVSVRDLTAVVSRDDAVDRDLIKANKDTTEAESLVSA